MPALLFILLCIQLFCLVMFIRNQLVFKHRIKAVDFIYNFQLNQLETSPKKHTTKTWNLLDNPSQEAMLFMITCWSYKSFYGNLEQSCKELAEKEYENLQQVSH